jgi:DNA-binding CsgD family transcriptional regulator
MTYCGDIPPLAILDKMPAMVYISDNATKTIRWCNPYMEKLTGYTIEEMHNLGIEFFRRVMHPSGFVKAIEAQQYFQLGQEKFTGFCRIRPLFGEDWTWLYGIAVPFNRDEDDNIKEVICVFQELSAQNTPLQLEWVTKTLLQQQIENYLSPLSKREKEVIYQMLADKDLTSVAEALNISLSTVKSHIKNIHQKLGIPSLRLLLLALTKL